MIIAPGFACVCGRPIKPLDFDVTDEGIVLDCPECYRRLLEIERHVEVSLPEID